MTKRLFLAMDLSIEVVERIVRLQEELESQLPDDVTVRWTDASTLHTTLKFFGEVEDDLVPFIEDTLAALAKPLFAFEVEARGVGAFPEPETPRIIWTGFDAHGGDVLGLLQKTIEKEMEELGFAADPRPFQPHITIGRVKSDATVSLAAVTDALQGHVFGKSHIRDIALFESRLTSMGPVYDVLSRFPLGS